MEISTVTNEKIYKSSSSSTTSSNSSSSKLNIEDNYNKQIIYQKQNNQNATNTSLNQNTKYIFILNAFVNGFAQLKLCADRIDYEYIIEIYWSNDSRSFVKRTYDDFVIFHQKFTCQFNQFFNDLSKANKNRSNNKSFNQINNKFSQFRSNTAYDIPILPTSKKRFWISNLKLAESREIELNLYVQRILKLPTNVSHSQIVLEFFESQSSDPKPAKSYLSRSIPNESCTEFGSDSLEGDNDEDEEESKSSDFTENGDDEDYLQNISNEDNRTNCYNKFKNEDYDSEDDNANKFLSNTNKKKNTKQAGLWWDEDNALNELTSSTSFEFGSQYHLSHNHSQFFNDTEHSIQEDYVNNVNNEDIETLESILKSSDLFSNIKESNHNITVSTSSSAYSYRHGNLTKQITKGLNTTKRLSLN